MPEHLVFTLYAPLASFGDIAIGERRGSWTRPGKSAILGLLAAALGLTRDDPAQAALAGGYDLAIRVDAAGRPLADYHTAQVPPARKGRRFATRREELLSGDLATILSRRDYRTDAAFTIVLRARAEAAYPLAALAKALRRPRFTLYAGRKSCPLGLPLNPHVIEAATLPGALATYDETAGALAKLARHGQQGAEKRRGASPLAELARRFAPLADGRRVIAADQAFEAELEEGRRLERRRDAPLSRTRWRFAPREEIVADLPKPEGGGR